MGKLSGSFTVAGNICDGIELGIKNPRLFAIECVNEFSLLPDYLLCSLKKQVIVRIIRVLQLYVSKWD